MEFGNILNNLNPTSIILMAFATMFALGQMLIKREEGASQREQVSTQSVQAILRFAEENASRLRKTEDRIAALENQLRARDQRVSELERLLHVKDTEIKNLQTEIEVLRKQVNAGTEAAK